MRKVPIVMAVRLQAIVLFGVVTTLGLVPPVAEAAGPENPVSPTAWAVDKREAVANGVFGSPTTEALSLDFTWVVTARVWPAHDRDPEVQFVLRKSAGGAVTAMVTELVKPLNHQLLQLYDDHRDDAADELAKLIEVDRLIITSSECKALKDIVKEFEELRPRLEVENVLVLDPRVYQLWVDAGSQQISFNLFGSSRGLSENPVIGWIERTLQRLARISHQR